MGKGRLEAFSDGVLAIIITIMVLELEPPHGADLEALRPLVPLFLSYVLSFVYLGIYWNNHHHLLHTVRRATAGVMWGNLHLLFWLSLVPFSTAWMGEHHHGEPMPTALYGANMLLAGLAYLHLQSAIVSSQGKESMLAAAIGGDLKGKLSGVAYAASIGLAWVSLWLSWGIFVAVALAWLIPDRRIERTLSGTTTPE